MLLRSSSTPVLGSLLPSFSDSPNRDFENTNKYPISSENSNFLKKISFSHGGYSNFSSFSCNSPPIPHSITGFSDSDREFSSPVQRGFRRAQSDGNLEGLAAAAYNVDEFHNSSSASRSYYRKPNTSNLQTIPSFSRYKSKDGFYEEDESDQDEEEEEEEEEICERDALLKRSVTIGDSIVAIGGGEFELENKNMGLIEEESRNKFCNFGVNEEEETVNSPLFLARGLGLDMGTGSFGGSGGDFTFLDSGENGRNGSNVEEYYKRMVEENPCNSLFLRNYAQFLYQVDGKKDGEGFLVVQLEEVEKQGKEIKKVKEGKEIEKEGEDIEKVEEEKEGEDKVVKRVNEVEVEEKEVEEAKNGDKIEKQEEEK